MTNLALRHGVPPQRRFLALWFPLLPVDRWRRATPADLLPDDGTPVACVEKIKGAMRLVAVDRRAATLGLTTDMTLADARAREADLHVFDADPFADQDWLDRLCDGAVRYTPIVAVDPPHGLVLDITGCAHLFGGESALAQDACHRLERAGLTVRHAFGPTAEGAHALARFQVASAPDEDQAIRRLPVAALRLSDESELALRRAGLKTVGDVAARPAAVIAARFGSEAVDAFDRLLGHASRPLDPRRSRPAIEIERRFAEPVGRTEYAFETLAELAREASAQLSDRGQGGRRFEALFFRTDGIMLPLRVETSLPSRDPDALMRLFGERLDSLSDPLDPGFGFDLLRLRVPKAEPLLPEQHMLEGRDVKRRDPAALATLVDKLSIRAGRNAVLRLTPRDSHIPEQTQFAFPALETRVPVPWPNPCSDDPPMRPLHLFDPPQPIDVIHGVPEGPPVQFRWRRSLHQVALYEGPERIAPEWWHDATPEEVESRRTRDYFRVEDARGRRFWIFRNGLYEEKPRPIWYLHGLFA